MANWKTLREVVVPTEHGGWGFTTEPLVLGLLVAPGLTAVALVIVGMAVFLGAPALAATDRGPPAGGGRRAQTSRSRCLLRWW